MSEQLYRKLVHYGNTWSTKTWTNPPSLDGSKVQILGTDLYYLKDTYFFKYNKMTSEWENSSPSSIPDSNGYSGAVWSDGEHIYFSRWSSKQFVLDKATNTWVSKTWNGFTDIFGQYIWTDGEHIYYSSGSNQYVLDKSTDTWIPKTWNGFTSIYGQRIWTDGEHVYYSTGASQYVLDKSTDTWVPKTWNINNLESSDIWFVEDNVYFSDESSHYKLNKNTDEWEAVTWSGLSNFRGYYIWSDGSNVYYSDSNTQYILDTTVTYEPATIPEPVEVPPSMKVKDRGGIWYPVKGVSVRIHGGSGPADVTSLPPTGAYISSYDPCLAFLGIDEMPKHIGTNYNDVDPWEDCSGEYIAEQRAYLSGSPYDGPHNLGDWYFLKVGDRVLAKSNLDSGFAPLIEFTEVPVTNMSLTVGGVAVSPGSVLIMEGDSPTVQVTTGSDSTKQYYYCNSDWFSYISEGTTDSIGSAYIGGNTMLIEIDPTNHTIGIAKYVYEAAI